MQGDFLREREGNIHRHGQLYGARGETCNSATPPWMYWKRGGAIRRSQSAPHMHVLVCICSNVEAVPQRVARATELLCYTLDCCRLCTYGPYFVNPGRFALYKTEKAHYRFNNLSTTLPVADPSWSSICCAMGPVAEE